MTFFSEANRGRAKEIVARYPRPKSAILPLAHLAQDQHGWLSAEAMNEIAELTGVTTAVVQGTCSFYTMLKHRPCGRFVVSVCTNVTCLVTGGPEVLHHLEERYLGDPDVTVEEVECLAACGGAPVMPTPAVRGMSPLTQALASASTLPPAPTGGTATPQLPPPTQRAEAGPGILGLPGAGTPARSVALAGGGGGYQAPSPLAAINQQGQAPPQAQPSAGLSALIAALAQRGQKVSPGGGLFQKAF